MQPQVEYVARNGSRLSDFDAQVVGEELEKLAVEDNGLEASRIVDAARNEHSLLHRFFEWDDSVAAERYREQQARTLANSIAVVVTAGETKAARETIRAFHLVTTPPSGLEPPGRSTQRYHPINVVTRRSDMAEEVVLQARKELIAFLNKYERYQFIRRDSRLEEVLAVVRNAIERLEEEG